MNDNIRIIFEPNQQNQFVIIYKPKGIPSAPLTCNETNSALNFAIDLFPEIKNVCGKKQIEYGLIHRIDTATDGLLLIATTQNAYDYFIEQQAQNKFIKYYKAECDFIKNIQNKMKGFPICENFSKVENFINNDSPYLKQIQIIQQSYFRFFEEGRKQVRPVIQNDKTAALEKASKKIYKTNIVIKKKENSILIDANISSGFKHQVRSHLAWCGIPVKNDLIYNLNTYDKTSKNDMKFTAYKLEFIHPTSKEKVVFEI